MAKRGNLDRLIVKDKDRIIDGYIFKLRYECMYLSFFFKRIFFKFRKARYSNSSKIVGRRTRIAFRRFSKEKFRFYSLNLLKTPRKIAENLFVRKNTRN